MEISSFHLKSFKTVKKMYILSIIFFKFLLDVDIIDLFLKIWERIPYFTNAIGLFICEFKIRGNLLERIYRELRGPPV